jgi:hypothetical protein
MYFLSASTVYTGDAGTDGCAPGSTERGALVVSGDTFSVATETPSGLATVSGTFTIDLDGTGLNVAVTCIQGVQGMEGSLSTTVPFTAGDNTITIGLVDSAATYTMISH